jgi:hypothetical protein
MMVAVMLLPPQLTNITIKILIILQPIFKGQTDLKMKQPENILGIATVSIMSESEHA